MIEKFLIEVQQKENFSIVSILPKVDILKTKYANNLIYSLDKKKLSFSQGIILQGKLPSWVFGVATCYYTPAKWVAIYDFQLNEAVVVLSNHVRRTLGSTVSLT